MSVVARPSMADEHGVSRFRILYQLLAALNHARTLDDVYDIALRSLLEGTAADRAAILLFDDDGVIRFKASRGGLSSEYQAAVTGHSPWRRGECDAHPIIVPDVSLDEPLTPYAAVLRQEGIRALVFVPLALDAGVFGKFMLYYAEPHECGPEELQMAEAIAAHVALATQHKHSEAARAQSEQRLLAILDNSPTVIFLKDPQGRYQLVNRRYEELFGVSRKDILGRTDYDIFPAATADRLQANDRAVLSARAPLDIEEYVPQADGVHTYASMKFPLMEADGSVIGVCGIATDITERKRLESASQHLAAIVESSGDAIISKDLNGIITSWNDSARRIFGYTAEEVRGKPVSILAAPGLDEMPEILSKIRRGHRLEHYETRRRKKDGQVIDISLTVSPIRNAAGTIVGASKIARDITDRKLSEQERARLLEREREARRIAELLNRAGLRLGAQLDLEKLVQEITDIGMALVGAECAAFFRNVPGTDEPDPRNPISGLLREAFAGQPMPRRDALFERTFRGKTVVRSADVTEDPQYSALMERQDPSAELYPIRSYLAAAVVTRSGEVLGGLFFGHSAPGRFVEMHEEIVTGLAAQAAIAMDNARLFENARWAQAELKRSNEELRRLNRDLEAFAYSASHDLQEPLRTIALSVQIIQRRWGRQMPEEADQFLAKVLAAAERMSILIEDLLAYTRATKYEEGPTPAADSRRVLADVLEILRGAIEESGTVVTTGELPTVAIHESRLAQLFQNLIGNAIKYRGAEAPRIAVSAVERDGWHVFSVADNGIGIEPQYADQIFGLFKRLHANEDYPGSGIGLAICQRVVEQYGGRVWLEQSTPGKGSTFCFAIPARPLDAQELAAPVQ